MGGVNLPRCARIFQFIYGATFAEKRHRTRRWGVHLMPLMKYLYIMKTDKGTGWWGTELYVRDKKGRFICLRKFRRWTRVCWWIYAGSGSKLLFSYSACELTPKIKLTLVFAKAQNAVRNTSHIQRTIVYTLLVCSVFGTCISRNDRQNQKALKILLYRCVLNSIRF